MKTKILAIILATFLFAPIYTQAQKRHHQYKEHKEEINLKKIAFITEKLSLTPEEAQVFWPIYNDFQNKREGCMKQNRMMKKDETVDLEKLSDKELTEMADAEITRSREILDLRIQYHENIKKVLPIKKVIMLYDAEKEFKKVLLKDLRQEKKNAHINGNNVIK